jgi:hypothetical protein
MSLRSSRSLIWRCRAGGRVVRIPALCFMRSSSHSPHDQTAQIPDEREVGPDAVQRAVYADYSGCPIDRGHRFEGTLGDNVSWHLPGAAADRGPAQRDLDSDSRIVLG